jgi:hypothetical protein
MSAAPITVTIQCKSCTGTGIYVGMGERDGIGVVCQQCHGTGGHEWTYTPFTARQRADVRSVHVARGYGLSPTHPACGGGLPYEQWEPGAVVPGDEKLYCPYLYTHQAWCARPDSRGLAPLRLGTMISDCPYWDDKAACWERYHATPDAPKVTQ